MTFGTKVFKNKKERGYLTFASGKRVVLFDTELAEFRDKVEFWQEITRLQERTK